MLWERQGYFCYPYRKKDLKVMLNQHMLIHSFIHSFIQNNCAFLGGTEYICDE